MTTPDPNHQQPQVVYVEKSQKPWYKRPGCIIPLILVVLLILVVGGCTALFGKAVSDVDKEMNTEHTVTYQIDGDAQDASATYNVGESETAQDTGLQAGWSKEVKVKGFFGAYLTATNGMYDTGTITCRILVDGKTVTENTGSGEFASASCSAGPDELKKAAE